MGHSPNPHNGRRGDSSYLKERREHESGLPAIPMCTGGRGVRMNQSTPTCF